MDGHGGKEGGREASIVTEIPRLFHIAPLPLAPGSIILPGNWGRIIRHAGHAHTLARRETELEKHRAAEWPEKPTRWEATFAFLSEAVARKFWNTRPTDLLYEVAHLTVGAPQHVGNLNAVEPIKGQGETWATAARRYWGNGLPDIPMPGLAEPPLEVVSASPLRIVAGLPR